MHKYTKTQIHKYKNTNKNTKIFAANSFTTDTCHASPLSSQGSSALYWNSFTAADGPQIHNYKTTKYTNITKYTNTKLPTKMNEILSVNIQY